MEGWRYGFRCFAKEETQEVDYSKLKESLTKLINKLKHKKKYIEVPFR